MGIADATVLENLLHLLVESQFQCATNNENTLHLCNNKPSNLFKFWYFFLGISKCIGRSIM